MNIMRSRPVAPRQAFRTNCGLSDVSRHEIYYEGIDAIRYEAYVANDNKETY